MKNKLDYNSPERSSICKIQYKCEVKLKKKGERENERERERYIRLTVT